MTKGSPLSPGQLSDRLVEIRSGVWHPQSGVAEVSYPADSHSQQADHQDSSFWYQHRLGCLQALFGRFPTSQLLDVGSSNGKLAKALPETEVLLLEPGAQGVAIAESLGLQPIIHADFQSAVFKPDVLPAVGLFDVLEHIEGDEAFLASVFESLKPGGRLYLTVPAYMALWSPFDEAVGHFRRYTTGELRRKLERAGFVMVYRGYLFSLLPLPMWLVRKLRGMRGQAKNDVADHAPANRGVGKLLSVLLRPEQAWIRRGWRVPFGSSCVVVAQKPMP